MRRLNQKIPPRSAQKYRLVDLTVLDKRRAHLERRLEKYDDFRLRFLLGFAEYYSGVEKLGLSNLTKAVEHVPEELSNVRRFVETLELYHQADTLRSSSDKQPTRP